MRRTTKRDGGGLVKNLCSDTHEWNIATRCFLDAGFSEAASDPTLMNLDIRESFVTYGSLSQKAGLIGSPPAEAK